jgi:molybdopterin synthase catalytic subunit
MIQLTKEKISVKKVIDQMRSLQVGAVASFLGTVRASSNGEKLKYLQYETYEEMARKKLAEIEYEAKSSFAIKDVAIIHRVGKLGVGEGALLVVIGASYRKDAFLACEYIVDELKKRVPIWKKEITNKGEHWVNLKLRRSK